MTVVRTWVGLVRAVPNSSRRSKGSHHGMFLARSSSRGLLRSSSRGKRRRLWSALGGRLLGGLVLVGGKELSKIFSEVSFELFPLFGTLAMPLEVMMEVSQLLLINTKVSVRITLLDLIQ